MGLGLFLVPVLGGYLLLTRLHYTRYDILRKSGYHLFFQSAIAGCVLVGVARPMVVLLNDGLPSTDYISVIRKCLEDSPVVPDLRYEDFRIVVPMSEVGSVRIFHPEVYEQFRPVEEPDGA